MKNCCGTKEIKFYTLLWENSTSVTGSVTVSVKCDHFPLTSLPAMFYSSRGQHMLLKPCPATNFKKLEEICGT